MFVFLFYLLLSSCMCMFMCMPQKTIQQLALSFHCGFWGETQVVRIVKQAFLPSKPSWRPRGCCMEALLVILIIPFINFSVFHKLQTAQRIRMHSQIVKIMLILKEKVQNQKKHMDVSQGDGLTPYQNDFQIVYVAPGRIKVCKSVTNVRGKQELWPNKFT